MANLSFTDLETLWTNAGGDPAVAPLMASIALAESGGNPGALNPNDNGGRQSSFGLWQISTGTHNPPSANWADPATNAQLAVAKYKSQGLGAWGTYTTGAYKKFLNANVGSAFLPPTPALASGTGQPSQGATGTYSKGDSDSVLSLPVIGTVLNRAQARGALGGLVAIPAGLLVLLGLAWMTGLDRLASPATSALGVVRPKDRLPEPGPPERAASRQRERRGREQEQSYRSARAQGERAAAMAGPF